jgi:hypothetical protein
MEKNVGIFPELSEYTLKCKRAMGWGGTGEEQKFLKITTPLRGKRARGGILGFREGELSALQIVFEAIENAHNCFRPRN